MSDYNRGPYAPGGEPPLAFPDRGAPRRRGPAPVTLILSVLLLAVVGGGVFYLYRGGARGPGDAPQPVGAPLHEVRSVAPPEDPDAGPGGGPFDLQGQSQLRRPPRPPSCRRPSSRRLGPWPLRRRAGRDHLAAPPPRR